MLTFLYPLAFTLVALPLLVRWFMPARAVSDVSVRVPFMDRVAAAGARTDAMKPEGPSVATQTAVWLLLLTALARPQWLEEPVEKILPVRDLLVLVDLSASMGYQDFTGMSGESVNRLDAVKEVLGEFLTQRKGDRVGMIVFGNAPFLQVPLTTDLALCEQLLNETQVGMAGPRTAFGDAIGLGIKRLKESSVPRKTIIAMTDGNDTSSAVPPVEAARIARDHQITIHTVAIGDPASVGEEQLDENVLRGVASTANGNYFRAMDRDQLTTIYRDLDRIETRELKTVSYRPRRELYFWPLCVALLVSVAAHGFRIAAEPSHGGKTEVSARVRVNSRTFELETTRE